MSTFVGLIPYAQHQGETYYLLGREAWMDGYADSGKWSGFGGGMESCDSSVVQGAAREAYEESMGFLGDIDTIVSAIGGQRVYVSNDNKYGGRSINYTKAPTKTKRLARAYMIPYPIAYDPSLPDLYIRVYDYVAAAASPGAQRQTDGCPHKIPARDGWYEKAEIDWFTLQEIFDEADSMRPAFLNSMRRIAESGQGPLFRLA